MPSASANATKTVLVVEDDADIRDSLVELLVDEGYRVIGASDGQQALDALAGRGIEPPRLVVLDLMMPVMNGYEFLERVRADTRLRGLPVIVMTAGDRAPPPQAQILEHLRKPISLDRLLGAVERYCI
jgi:CheY-like chemotaxis protein